MEPGIGIGSLIFHAFVPNSEIEGDLTGEGEGDRRRNTYLTPTSTRQRRSARLLLVSAPRRWPHWDPVPDENKQRPIAFIYSYFAFIFGVWSLLMRYVNVLEVQRLAEIDAPACAIAAGKLGQK